MLGGNEIQSPRRGPGVEYLGSMSGGKGRLGTTVQYEIECVYF